MKIQKHTVLLQVHIHKNKNTKEEDKNGQKDLLEQVIDQHEVAATCLLPCLTIDLCTCSLGNQRFPNSCFLLVYN